MPAELLHAKTDYLSCGNKFYRLFLQNEHDFIDCYISPTKVLIEQKGSHVDLGTKYRQSDGQELTPYQQARRYAAGLPLAQHPRWIVACNFTTFEVHGMEHPNDASESIRLADLEQEYTRLFQLKNLNILRFHTKFQK